MLDVLFAWWWLGLLEALVLAGVMGLVVLNADKLVGEAPRSLAALRGMMLFTVAAMIGAYIAVVGLSLYMLEAYTGLQFESLAFLAGLAAAGMLLFQWLLSPYLINAVYAARPPGPREEWLERELEELARRSGIRKPKLVIAEVAMPNAFAYGSPLTGSYVAVTRGLLRLLSRDEVRAVLAHEVGHLKHRDVSVILALTLLPVAAYFIGRALIWLGLLGGDGERRSNPLVIAAIGAALLAAGFLFELAVAHFNRLREYYADAHSALVTGAPRALQRALAKLHLAYESRPELKAEAEERSLAAMLYIVAPLVELSGGYFYDVDYYVEQLKRQKVNPVLELFSTHPPIPKRLRFLDRLAMGAR